MNMPAATRRDFQAMNAINETRNGVARIGNGCEDISPWQAYMLVEAGLATTFQGTFSNCAELTEKGRDYLWQIEERYMVK